MLASDPAFTPSIDPSTHNNNPGILAVRALRQPDAFSDNHESNQLIPNMEYALCKDGRFRHPRSFCHPVEHFDPQNIPRTLFLRV